MTEADIAEAKAADRAAKQKAAAEAKAAADARAQAQRDAEVAGKKAVPDDTGPTNRTKTANRIIAEQEAKLKASRAAVLSDGDPDPIVRVRITKAGDGKVSMGEHAGGIGEAHYEWKEEPLFPRSIAQALEDRGFVEILDESPE